MSTACSKSSNENEPNAPFKRSPSSFAFIELTAFIIKLLSSAESVAIMENGVAELVGVAEVFDIPIITSLVKSNQIGSQLSARSKAKSPQLDRHIRSSLNPWDDPAFAEAIQTKPVLPSDCWLSAEISLSFTALNALAKGFDVFVIKDVYLGYLCQQQDQ